MPEWKVEIRRRLASLQLAPTREAAIIEELAQHLDDCYAELLSGGATEAEAYQRTLAELSGNELLARELRRVERQVAPEPIVLGTNRRTNMIADLWQDLRFGARMLMKQPGFTLIAALTLSLGIGANTAIFSVVNALLLRPPSAVEQPERLVLATWEGTGLGPSYPDYVDYRDRNTTLAGLATFGPTTLHLSAGNEAERLPGAFVSGNYFNVLGVKAASGRVLSAEDDTAPGANSVAVISDGLWRRRFNADPNVVGRTVRLDGYPFIVVGVAPPGFIGVETGCTTDIWAPVSMVAQADATLAGAPSTRVARGWLRAFGRLKANVSLEQAQAELTGLARALEQAFPNTNKGVGIRLIPNLGLGPEQRKDARNFTVLLIACANVANLLLQ